MMAYKEILEKIHQFSGDMLSYSQKADWESVAATEVSRQQLLTQLATLQIAEFDGAVESLLHQVIAINAEIEKLSRQEMAVCRQSYLDVKNNKSAINAYSDL